MQAYEDTSLFTHKVVYEDKFGDMWERQEESHYYRFYKWNGEIFVFDGNLINLAYDGQSIEYIHKEYMKVRGQ